MRRTVSRLNSSSASKDRPPLQAVPPLALWYRVPLSVRRLLLHPYLLRSPKLHLRPR